MALIGRVRVLSTKAHLALEMWLYTLMVLNMVTTCQLLLVLITVGTVKKVITMVVMESITSLVA